MLLNGRNENTRNGNFLRLIQENDKKDLIQQTIAVHDFTILRLFITLKNTKLL